MLKALFIIIAVFTWCVKATSQENYNYTTDRISYQIGLSQSKVTAICKDHLGYIWIGTEHGLNRYDGFEIKKYFSNTNESNSISDNYVNFIFEDQNNKLWISTLEGLNIYDRLQDNFTHESIDNKPRNYISYLEIEGQIIFSSSQSEIIIYTKQKEEFNLLRSDISKIQDSGPMAVILFAPWDSDKVLALNGWPGWLYILNINSGEAEYFCKIPQGDYTRILVSGNNIWLSSIDGGIFKIDKTSLEVTNYNASNSELPIDIVPDIKLHPETQDIWVATDGSGVLVFDQSFSLKNMLRSGPNVKEILPENSINRIFFDNDDVWLGTVRSGIVYLTPSEFDHFPPLSMTCYGPSDKSILAIFEDSQNYIWLGTDGGGLNRFDNRTNTFEHYVNDQTRKITSIVEYDENRLLLASYRTGLFFFDKRNNSFHSVENETLLNQIKKKTRHRLFRDSNDNIWISDQTIWKITPSTNHKVQYTIESNPKIFSGISSNFNSVHEDGNNNIWFSALGGIFRYNHERAQLDRAVYLPFLNSLYGRMVYSITSDNDDNIIFGTDNGVYMLNRETQIIYTIIQNKPPESRIYYTLYTSEDNQLWAATSDGLLWFRKDETGKYSPTHFKNKFNFEYCFGSLLEASDGNVYFGGNEGFIRFKPEEIETDTTLITPIITSFRLWGTKHNTPEDALIIPFVTDSASVTLTYSASTYNFTFNAFDYSDKEQIRYQYKLENFEEVWHDSPARNAIYTSLPAGNYVFRVKAANCSGIWNDKTTNLYLNVLPLWWQTIWVKIALLALIIGISIMIWVESLNKAKLRNQLKLEKLEQDKLKEINQMKLRFFTNISHELRTPLTLIYAPLEQLVKRNSSPDEIKKLLPFIFRNVRRLHQLINQLLEFRKTEMSTLSLNLEEIDLVAHCMYIIDHFSHQAEIDHVKILFSPQTDKFRFVCDSDMFFKMLSNLLSNALKHTGVGGKIEIILSQGDKAQAIMMVSDTGVGISADEQEKIFERFYQTDHKEAGTGIGLAFTKRLVELHKGEIRVKSILGEGTTFTIELPQTDTAVSKSTSIEDYETFEDPKSDVAVTSIEEYDNSSTNLHILIAEDEWELRQYLIQILSGKYKVIVAKNGEEAFSKAIELLPDLILTDVMMPVMDGYELCKKVKLDLRISHIPVIMLTAKSQTDSQIEGFEAGADAYIPKPFDNNLLLMRISAILQNRSILKERFSHDMDLNPEELPQSSADEKYLHNAISIVEMNLDNSQFDVSAFVNEIGMSRTLVYNKTKAITGKPIKDFILHIRLRKAAASLINTQMSITEIAINCGFADPSYFSTVFKRYYKESPTEYRKHR